MRLNKNQIEHLGFVILRQSVEGREAHRGGRHRLFDEMINLMMDEFLKEDQLDQEVRELLGKHMEKIRRRTSSTRRCSG